MNFSQFLNEAPYLMHFNRDEIDEVADTYETVMKYKVGNEGFYDEKYDIIHYKKKDKNNDYAIVDHDKKRVLVNSKLFEITRGGKKYWRQALLWKAPGVKSDMVDYLFLNIIVEKNKMILSDDIQTVGSMSFWRRHIKKLIGASRYTLGYVDKSGNVIKFNKDSWQETFDEMYSMEHAETSIFIKQMD